MFILVLWQHLRWEDVLGSCLWFRGPVEILVEQEHRKQIAEVYPIISCWVPMAK